MNSAFPRGGLYQMSVWLGDLYLFFVCQKGTSGWDTWSQEFLQRLDSIKEKIPSQADCNLIEKGNTMQVNFNITQELSRHNITCQACNTTKCVKASSFLRIAPIYGEATLIHRSVWARSVACCWIRGLNQYTVIMARTEMIIITHCLKTTWKI